MNNPFEILNERLSNIENMLYDLKYPVPQKGVKPTADRLNLEECVNFIQTSAGLRKISKSTIYNKSSQGQIPSHKFNNRLIFYKSEIEQWIESEFSGKSTSKIEIKLPKK